MKKRRKNGMVTSTKPANEVAVPRISQLEVVTLAVFLLGGDEQVVDTEDVAMKVNAIAPGRFSWRKYPEQVNLELVRVFLSDAKKPEFGGLVSGSGARGW